jgi:hypothetical protein
MQVDNDSATVAIEEILTLLAAAPLRLSSLSAALSPAQLQTAPNDGEWSANEVLAHLRSCADVWGGYIARILAEDGPTIRAVSPRGWIRKTDYLEQAFHSSLRAFTNQRTDLLVTLEPLTPERWSRAATVKHAGKIHQRTVLFYAQSLAGHEARHLEQFERIVTTMNT